MSISVPAVSRLAPRLIHGAVSSLAPAAVAVVSPTIVPMVTAANTISEVIEAATSTAPASSDTRTCVIPAASDNRTVRRVGYRRVRDRTASGIQWSGSTAWPNPTPAAAAIRAGSVFTAATIASHLRIDEYEQLLP